MPDGAAGTDVKIGAMSRVSADAVFRADRSRLVPFSAPFEPHKLPHVDWSAELSAELIWAGMATALSDTVTSGLHTLAEASLWWRGW